MSGDGESSDAVEPGGPVRMVDAGGADRRRFLEAVDLVSALLDDADIDYAVVGGLAVAAWGRPRWTHDLDLMLEPDRAIRALRVLEDAGFETEETDPLWLFKAWTEEVIVDLIFCTVGQIYYDRQMSARTAETDLLGRRLRVVAPEDLIVIKAAAFQEDSPYHWFDALTVLARQDLDWDYLLARAQQQPRRVLALLVWADSLDVAVPQEIIGQLAAGRYQPWLSPTSSSPEPPEQGMPDPAGPPTSVVSPAGRRQLDRDERSDRQGTVRVAAVGDLHLGADHAHELAPLVQQVSQASDLLLLVGDLTRRGRLVEFEAIAGQLAELTIPAVVVFGNHEYDSDRVEEGRELLDGAGVDVLEGDTAVFEEAGTTVGVAGGIGFGGGFAGAEMGAFGEPEFKTYVRRSEVCAERVGEALAGLEADLRLMLTHYSPTRGTLAGENPELFPVLGSRRLADVADRAQVDAVVHGHAHHGSPAASTPAGIPVYNVAQPVLDGNWKLLELEAGRPPVVRGQARDPGS